MVNEETVAIRSRRAGYKLALQEVVELAEAEENRTHLPAANRLANLIRKLRYMRDHAE